MKWGVWNDETRARRTGTKRRRPKKDYSKMSDKRLRREVNRRRTINDLRRMDEEEAKKNKPQITKNILAVSKFIGALGGLSVAVITLRNKGPEAAKAVKEAASFVSSFMSNSGNVPVSDIANAMEAALDEAYK
jgi:hypothetical protein